MAVPARPVPHLLVALTALAALAPILGCQSPGVGDPCEPESTPADGFLARESYLETSSVQCSTRVCMVYQLDGMPNRDDACVPSAGVRCATPAETAEHVYCSCRCAGPGDRHCECPDGFACAEVLTAQTVPDGIRGSYCIRASTLAR